VRGRAGVQACLKHGELLGVQPASFTTGAFGGQRRRCTVASGAPPGAR
jgi:hypothetical protein